MNLSLSNILVALCALLHLFFLYLEIFLWTKPLGLKIFRRSLEQAKNSASLAANQGLYNGFLAAGLTWGLLHPNQELGHQLKIFFLICVIIAGIFGAMTASRKIFFVQAMPAILALSLVLLT